MQNYMPNKVYSVNDLIANAKGNDKTLLEKIANSKVGKGVAASLIGLYAASTLGCASIGKDYGVNINGVPVKSAQSEQTATDANPEVKQEKTWLQKYWPLVVIGAGAGAAAIILSNDGDDGGGGGGSGGSGD